MISQNIPPVNMSQYIPYGLEWKKEMMRWNKNQLIEYLGEVLQRCQAIKTDPITRSRTTAKQSLTEQFVNFYTKQFGYPPTYQEITDQFGLKSKSAAYARCRKFRDKMIKRK